MKRFMHKIIVVTGGTRGIGRAMTLAFLQEGASVIATYASNDAAALEFKESLGEMGLRLFLEKFDVSDSSQVTQFFKVLEDKFNSCHILINNSGIRQDAMVAMMKDQEWQRVLAVNLDGTFHMSRGVIPLMMKNRWGRIISISSIGGELGLAGQANYAATKAAQIGFSKSLSKEVARKGITVNVVCPGFIETEMITDLPQQLKEEYLKQIPARKFGRPEDVANAVLFLASDQASYITGSKINVSGGLG